MKYNEGDKVRIKSKEWYNNNKDEYGNVHLINKHGWMFTKRDSRFCGKVVTILLKGTTSYAIIEDNCEGFWTDDMIECKVGEKKKTTRKEQIMEAAMFFAKKNKNNPSPYLDFVEAAEWADRTMIAKISEYLEDKLPIEEINKLCKALEE